jgi:hypothetical protein
MTDADRSATEDPMRGADLADIVRKVVDDNVYMVLGTADRAGRPWVSPVFYAVEAYRDFYWIVARRHPFAQPRRPPGGRHRRLRLASTRRHGRCPSGLHGGNRDRGTSG